MRRDKRTAIRDWTLGYFSTRWAASLSFSRQLGFPFWGYPAGSVYTGHHPFDPPSCIFPRGAAFASAWRHCIILNFFGHPDCSKIATTQIVNQAEVFLKQNLAAWQALPADQKTPATQQQALQNFDNVWAQVMQACNGTGQHGSAASPALPIASKGLVTIR